jgi:hypothetical protein
MRLRCGDRVEPDIKTPKLVKFDICHERPVAATSDGVNEQKFGAESQVRWWGAKRNLSHMRTLILIGVIILPSPAARSEPVTTRGCRE